MKAPQTAFVAGATGYTGREVVRQLCRRGVKTYAHIRPDSPHLEEWRARFEVLGAVIDSTPWKLDAMSQTLRRLRPEAVFALLGTTRARMHKLSRTGQNPESASYENVDYKLTHLLLQAAATVVPHPVFVYLSSLGAGGTARGAYLQARHKAEADLLQSGLPYIIARPSIITGPDRDESRPLEKWSATFLSEGLTLLQGLGLKKMAQRFLPTTNKDLAAALTRLALSPKDWSQIYESDSLRD